MAKPDWSHDYFERAYAQRWGLSAPSDRVRSEATGLFNLLQLAASDRIIDVGCGHGRHAVALAERGLNITGVDTSRALLKRAQQLAAEGGVNVRWVRGDMRRLPLLTGSADAVIMIDAFGFFETEDEHDRVLQAAASVLRARGSFVMKVLNGSHVLDAFRERDHGERDGTAISISRTLSLDPARLIERITFSGARGTEEYERRQRLYRAAELGAALERAGFAIAGLHAGPDGTPFEPTTSSTIWMVGRR